MIIFQQFKQFSFHEQLNLKSKKNKAYESEEILFHPLKIDQKNK
jgi:hypothetical protein